uniref:Uncharacterized protein n=1 Tax=Rhizophora mucronata TaxID=61149 RepID=A0A2P2MXS3_RHIMU
MDPYHVTRFQEYIQFFNSFQFFKNFSFRVLFPAHL